MNEYLIFPAENWVNISEIDTSQYNNNDSPFSFLLVDYQELVSENKICTYKRTVEKINDASRIEDASLFLFELQENNHQIIFHAIDIIRGGERFNALAPEKISINQREKSLENHITNCRKTVSISIDDLRVGDVVDYSATDIIHATEHPINGKHYHTVFSLNWNCPVHLQSIRIVNHSKRMIHLQRCMLENGNLVSKVINVKPKTTFLQEYIDLPQMPIENEAPDWLWSDFLLATTHTEWNELSSGLYNNYTALGVFDNTIKVKELPDIDLNDELADNIIKIVRFVQNEIRYKGENHGVFTHTPKKPEHTLNKRYGDCKDKSNLLVCLLRQLKVDAHLTLVNTEYGIKISQLSPSPFHFNHMIVHIDFNGKDYYFDPTIKKQEGDLENCATLNYGFGLILSEEGTSLQQLPHDISEEVFNLHHIFNFSDLENSGSTLSIHRTYYRHRADNMRYFLQSTENKKLASDFLKYAKEDTSLDLSIEKQMTTVHDDVILNILKTEEIYSIKNVMGSTVDDQLHLLTSIYLEFPTTLNTDHPLRIDLDGLISHDIEIIYKNSPLQSEENKTIKNNWFSYQDSISKAGNTLYLSASASPKKQYVESQDIDTYLNDVEEMRLRSINNFPYAMTDSSMLKKIGHWMILSSWLIVFIIVLMTRLS